MLQKNQTLFDDVMGLIDGFEQNGIPIPGDVEVPSPPPTPTLQELNVPQQVKDWITDSKAPSQKAHNRQADAARPSLLTGNSARPAVAPELTRITATKKTVRSVETDGVDVPNLVPRYDGHGPSSRSLKEGSQAHTARSESTRPSHTRQPRVPAIQITTPESTSIPYTAWYNELTFGRHDFYER